MSADPFSIDGHKMQYHPARVASWVGAKSIEEKLAIYPIYVEISPVGHCNHRCTFCAVDYIGYKTRRIDTNVLTAALADMAIKGVKSVMFAGEGEPMLHPDIDTLTLMAFQYNLDVSFTTNGTALTKKFVDNALHATKWIKVSMNGGDKETYARIHQTKETDFDRVWANLEYALDHRKNKTTAIGLQTVVLPDNIQSIPTLITRAKAVGVDYVVLKPYSQHKKSHTGTYADITYANKTAELQDLTKENTSKFKVIVRLNAMGDWDEGAHTYDKCHATPYFWAYIMATGDVYGCSAYLLDDRFNYGNINSTPFEKIWTGQKRQESIRFVEEELNISSCRLNCRMNQVNKALNDIKGGNPHANFI